MKEPLDLRITLWHVEEDTYRLLMERDDPVAPGDPLPPGDHTVQIDLETALAKSGDPDAFGRWLGESVFGDPETRSALERVVTRAEHEERPLRLRWEVDSRLQSLNWETLILPRLGRVALRRQVLFTRFLRGGTDRPVNRRRPDALRAVVAVAAPAGLEAYGLATPQRADLENAARSALGPARVATCHGSLGALRIALTQEADVLYLACHGAVGKEGPVLLLEDDEPATRGQVRRVPGQALADFLADLAAPPRLVVLLSCQGAGAGVPRTQPDSMLATGPLLVRAGVPAVLAMQGNIAIETGTRFMSAFFGALVAEDGAIDRAVNEGRWTVRERLDAWAPVLFLRLKDGRLWEEADVPPPPALDNAPPFSPDLSGELEAEMAAFLSHVAELLLPHVWSVQDRKDFLNEAFLTTDPWIRHYIELDGPPAVFTRSFLRTLVRQRPALLESVLRELRKRVGQHQQAEIDRLRQALPAFPVAGAAGENAPAMPATATGPVAGSGKQPAIYLVYGSQDEPQAEQLRGDLALRGYRCWPRSGPGLEQDGWLADINAGLSNSYTVVVLIGEHTYRDKRAQLELLGAQDKRKPIISALLGDYPWPSVIGRQPDAITLAADYRAGFADLVKHLSLPLAPPAGEMWSLSPQLAQRAAELAHMDRLKLEELQHVARYTPLRALSTAKRTRGDRLQLEPAVVRHEYAFKPWAKQEAGGVAGAPVAERTFRDAVSALQEIRRAILLGEPGAGKTTTLYRLAAELIDAALLDREAPVPIFVRLGGWTAESEPFRDFLRRQAGELGENLEARLETRRAALLLDGLNEIPVNQQQAKVAEIDRFLTETAQPQRATSEGTPLMVIASCRERDYTAELQLKLDEVRVTPLDPLRIHEFVHNYLAPEHGAQAAEKLFWQLAGEEARAAYEQFQAEAGELENPLRIFWQREDLPQNRRWSGWGSWKRLRRRPTSLMNLASNPYMLFMLVEIFLDTRQRLPANRAQLFDWFVERLLVRERLWDFERSTKKAVRKPAGDELLDRLQGFALLMQLRRGGDERTASATTVVSLEETAMYLNREQLHQAVSASLLVVGDGVRFAHQLLQEYFTARAMNAQIFGLSGSRPGLEAKEIWQRPRWWEFRKRRGWDPAAPTGWEEATILLAGLHSTDCSSVLSWVAEANPEVAARCIVESGAETPEETLRALQEKWLAQLTDSSREANPRVLPLIGRALGTVRFKDGRPFDNRPGVCTLEPVLCAPIAAGKIRLRANNEERAFETFQVAKYLVTNAQFRMFVDEGGYAEEGWWRKEGWKQRSQQGWAEPAYWDDPRFNRDNQPVVGASMFEAEAYASWLSAKTGKTYRLPTEAEWERAAGHTDGREFAWAGAWQEDHANTLEAQLGGPSAVGMFPRGAAACGAQDMCGNVIEWTDFWYDDDRDIRVLRGGSFYNDQGFARVGYRLNVYPGYRYLSVGFRLVSPVDPGS